MTNTRQKCSISMLFFFFIHSSNMGDNYAARERIGVEGAISNLTAFQTLFYT